MNTLNQVIFEDNRSALLKIPDKSVDLIFIDPPYDISKDSNFHNTSLKQFKDKTHQFGSWDTSLDWDFYIKESYRILKDGGTFISFYDVWKLHELKDIVDSNRISFNQPRVLIWEKSNPQPINSAKNYLSNSREYMVSFIKKGNNTFNSNYDSGVFKFSTNKLRKIKHPTVKPVNLIREIIRKHSNENDTVLDFFAGSGTTGQACKEIDRNFILIENNIEYIEMCKIRGLKVV